MQYSQSVSLAALSALNQARPTQRKILVAPDINWGREILFALAWRTGGWIGWEPATLKSIADPKRPIRVILIGIGTDASEAQMKTVTDAIGGATFVAPDPAKIGEIFLQAIALRATS